MFDTTDRIWLALELAICYQQTEQQVKNFSKEIQSLVLTPLRACGIRVVGKKDFDEALSSLQVL